MVLQIRRLAAPIWILVCLSVSQQQTFRQEIKNFLNYIPEKFFLNIQNPGGEGKKEKNDSRPCLLHKVQTPRSSTRLQIWQLRFISVTLFQLPSCSPASVTLQPAPGDTGKVSIIFITAWSRALVWILVPYVMQRLMFVDLLVVILSINNILYFYRHCIPH